jgi:hypothetical protein
MTNEQRLEKIKSFIQEKSPGQCKRLSKGNQCECLLCCADGLYDAIQGKTFTLVNSRTERIVLDNDSNL